ncbi:hypothetical protein B0H11DRAFT_2032370, partial [Mycena galericulata]
MTNGRLGKRNVRFFPSVVLILLSDMARMRPTGTRSGRILMVQSLQSLPSVVGGCDLHDWRFQRREHKDDTQWAAVVCSYGVCS